MKVYKITETKQYKYLGQCDRLRRNNAIGERNWHKMIKEHVKVSMEEFMAKCDWQAIEDEDAEDMQEFIASDPSSYFAKSIWGEDECYYVMSGGFEFIFVK